MDSWLVIFILGNLTFFALILWIFAYYRLGRQRQRSDERLRLLERFSSAEELSDFLATPQGKHLIERLGSRPADPKKAIVLVIAVGVVTIVVGLAFGAIVVLGLEGNDPGPKIAGTLLVAGGCGMMLAAGVSAALAARWGLMRPASKTGDELGGA